MTSTVAEVEITRMPPHNRQQLLAALDRVAEVSATFARCRVLLGKKMARSLPGGVVLLGGNDRVTVLSAGRVVAEEGAGTQRCIFERGDWMRLLDGA